MVSGNFSNYTALVFTGGTAIISYTNMTLWLGDNKKRIRDGISEPFVRLQKYSRWKEDIIHYIILHPDALEDDN